MRKHGRETRSVSLFPFLAVLICAMGALIFLLVVTTRRIRHQALQQVQSVSMEEVVEEDFFPPVLFAAEVLEPEMPAPKIIKPEEPIAIPEPEPQVVNLAIEHEARLRALSLERAKKLTALKSQNQNLIRLKNELTQSESILNESKQQLQVLSQKDKELNDKMAQITQQKLRAAELLQEELHLLQEKKASRKTARSKYSVIPYDGQTGTAKRPILIECTDKGLTFIPEGITLTPDDLKDFTPGYNPLLAGTQALVKYWQNKSQQSDQEPYVLILVRPSGSVGYYVARKLLNNLSLDSGYELIDADWDFELPEKDLIAEEVCQDAIDRVLSERKQLVSQLHQHQDGSGSGGRRLQFDARTGMVRVIEPEDELGTGAGSHQQPGKLAARKRGEANGESRFSDVLTPRQQMARAKYLQRLANERHIVANEVPGKTESEQRGLNSGESSASTQQRAGTFKRIPGSRQGAEVYDLADLKAQKGQNQSVGRDSGLKQAKVMGREQLKREAEQHLVALDGSKASGTSDFRNQESQTESTSASVANRVIENAFRSEGSQGQGTQKNEGQSQSGSKRSKQERRSSQSQARSEGAPPGKSSSGAGNSMSSFAFNRSKGGAHSEIKSSKNQRWQPHQSRSGIGFEREITVQVGADRIIVGDKQSVRVNQGVTQDELLQSMIMVMDQHVDAWGPAPKGFYWVPTIQFTISPGGNQYYERLKLSAQKMGLQTEAQYTLDPLPVTSSPISEKEQ